MSSTDILHKFSAGVAILLPHPFTVMKITPLVLQEASTSKAALDEGLAKKLWEKSEALVGLKPEEANF